jgi:hypothetical protein
VKELNISALVSLDSSTVFYMEKVNIDALTSIAIYQSRDCSMENFYDAGTELPYQQWRNRVTYHSDDRNIKLPSCYAGTELLICQEGTVAYLR